MYTEQASKHTENKQVYSICPGSCEFDKDRTICDTVYSIQCTPIEEENTVAAHKRGLSDASYHDVVSIIIISALGWLRVNI